MQRTIIVLSLLLSVLQAPAGLASTYDPAEAKAAMDAMLQMNKISIAELDAAVGE